MRISQILQTKRSDVVIISPESTIRSAVNLMKHSRSEHWWSWIPIGPCSVCLSERDIIHGLASQGAEALHQPVSACMRTDAPVVKLQDTVQSAMHAMTASASAICRSSMLGESWASSASAMSSSRAWTRRLKRTAFCRKWPAFACCKFRRRPGA